MVKKEEENTNITDLNMSDDGLAAQIAEAQAKYLSWQPKVEGAIIAGKAIEVKDYPFMHQGKGSIMMVVDTGIKVPTEADEDNTKVAVWMNTVAQSQALKIRNAMKSNSDNPVEMEADHETRADAIRELVGKELIIKYDGVQKSSDKAKSKLNAYQKYVIIEKKVGK